MSSAEEKWLIEGRRRKSKVEEGRRRGRGREGRGGDQGNYKESQGAAVSGREGCKTVASC